MPARPRDNVGTLPIASGIPMAQQLLSDAASNAIRDGRLRRGPCEVCGVTEHVDGHHDDYAEAVRRALAVPRASS